MYESKKSQSQKAKRWKKQRELNFKETKEEGRAQENLKLGG